MSQGEKITVSNGVLNVPNNPIIPFIEGDGTGPDIWNAASKVLEAAVEKAYKGEKKITWKEVYAGEKAYNKTGEWLPAKTLEDIREYFIAIKGPLTTPVGGGIRSLNVALLLYLFQMILCQELPLILSPTPTAIAPAICLSLQNSLACPAFHQFYISTGVVDRYPFLQNNITTIQDFDNSLFNYVNSTSNYLLQLGCLSTNYNPIVPYARYSLTKMCARLIQDPEDSLPCNTNHHLTPPPLCKQTCLDWVESVTAITSQSTVCGNNLQRTEAIANYTIHCQSWQGFNATADDNCISGIANEPENCGKNK